jgi:Tfp pilus assembly protein PilE
MKSNPWYNGMGRRGVTLVELIIAVTVVMILAVALNFSFQGWMGGYNVESEIKQIHSDLLNAKARATERARFHFFYFPGATPYASYTLYEDDSDGVKKVPDGDTLLQTGTGATADTQLGGYPQPLRYLATTCTGTITADKTSDGVAKPGFIFDKKGFIMAGAGTSWSIKIDSTGYNPDYNCILVTNTKINIGKLNASSNCVVK